MRKRGKRVRLFEQIHVRVPAELHRAIKMHCAASGLTIQDWASSLFARAIEDSDAIPVVPSGRSEARAMTSGVVAKEKGTRDKPTPSVKKRTR